MINHEDAVVDNWKHLRVRILLAHKSKKSSEEIQEAMDKEFINLGRRLLKLQVSPGSYKILKVDPTNITKGHITIRSKDGHCINLYERDYELFNTWVNSPAGEKLVTRSVYGPKGYRTQKTYPEETAVKQHWQICEESEKMMNGDAGDID